MTPLFGFYDDLERYSSTVNSNFVLNIPYTLLREIFIKWETEQKKYILPKEENKMSFGEVSAVEWLVDQMFKQGYFDGNKPLSITNLDHLQHQAKEIEYKQNMSHMQRGMELQEKENNRIGFRERNGLTSSQTEISDEEIEKEANNLFAGDLMWSERIAFKVAIKWYREQLKQRQ